MPLISVIMGVYNSKRKELLKKSIESILNQTVNDFEFIICDDHSTNLEIIKILEYYKSIDSRIILLKNEKNLGLASTLNRCLEIASGIYIARQDDDDISHLDRFKIEIDYLKNHPEISLVGCNISLFDEKGLWGERKHTEFPTKKDFIHGSQFAHPTTIVRSESIRDVNGYKVSRYTTRTEDYDLYMRMYAAGYKGVNIQQVLYDYYESDLTYKQQKFRHRLDEYHVRYYGFKALGLLPRYYIFCLKPIISGITPKFIKKKIKRNRYKR